MAFLWRRNMSISSTFECTFLEDVGTLLQDDDSVNFEMIAGIRKLVEKMDTRAISPNKPD
jgi:hypothetical protein